MADETEDIKSIETYDGIKKGHKSTEHFLKLIRLFLAGKNPTTKNLAQNYLGDIMMDLESNEGFPDLLIIKNELNKIL